MTVDEADWKGLIRESYRIEGITSEECRSIFLDWAISLRGDNDVRELIAVLLNKYQSQSPDHPMTAVLREGLQAPASKGRRGGRKARVES